MNHKMTFWIVFLPINLDKIIMNCSLYRLISKTAFFLATCSFDGIVGLFLVELRCTLCKWYSGRMLSYVHQKYIWNRITTKTEHFANIDIFSFILVWFCFRQWHFWFCSFLRNTKRVEHYWPFNLEILSKSTFQDIKNAWPHFLGLECSGSNSDSELRNFYLSIFLLRRFNV